MTDISTTVIAAPTTEAATPTNEATTAATPETTPTTPATPAAPVVDKDAQRLEYYSQRERQIVERARQVEAQRLETDKRIKELEAIDARRAKYEADLATLRENPLKFIWEHSHQTFEDLAKHQLLDPANPATSPAGQTLDPTIREMRERIERMEAADQARQKAAEDARKAEDAKRQEAEYDRLVKHHLDEQWAESAKTPDDFELSLTYPDRARDLYIKTYEEMFQVHGRLLTPSECADLRRRVEDDLTKQEDERISRLSTSKRFASRFAAPKPVVPPPIEPSRPAAPVTSSPPPRRDVDTHPALAASGIAQRVFDEGLERVGRKFPKGQ